MLLRHFLSLFCVVSLIGSADSVRSDPVQRERVLIGEVISPEATDRQVLKAMLQDRLRVMPDEMSIDTQTWPHFGRLSAETEDSLATTANALAMTLKQRTDVLAIISGYNVNGTISTTIALGEAAPGFTVEIGHADIPRKGSFRNSRDSAVLLLYYALLKDAEANKMSRQDVINPLLGVALEIAKDVSKQDQEPWVKEIVQNLQSLQATP